MGAVTLGHIIDWFTARAQWHGTNGIPHRLSEHVWVSFVSVAIACAVALPIGIVLGHLRRGGVIAQNLANIGRAIPSFAILIVAVPIVGIGFRPAELALTALAIPPILTNAYVGMIGVDEDVRDAARGMGMNGWQAVWRAELPLALPLVFAGVSTATFQIIATAALAAFVAAGGLGQYILEGIQLRDNVELICGSLLVIALAGSVEALFTVLERLVVAAPIRHPIRSTNQLEAPIHAN